MTLRRRVTDSDLEALMSGHTPPQRPDLGPTAAFLRELPAQLSESEPIELAAPPRRRTRLLVAMGASAAAIAGLAGLVAVRTGHGVVRPSVGGAAVDTTAAATADSTAVAAGAATAGAPGSVTTATEADTPAARYVAAFLAWNECVTTRGADACGPEPDPVAFGLPAPTTTVPASAGPPTTAAASPATAAP